jgi:hypothetical protein
MFLARHCQKSFDKNFIKLRETDDQNLSENTLIIRLKKKFILFFCEKNSRYPAVILMQKIYFIQ